MSQNKTVPIRDADGIQIGSVSVEETGIIVGEMDDSLWDFSKVESFTVNNKES